MLKSKKQINSTLITRSYIFNSKELCEKLGIDGDLDEIALYEGIEPQLKREAIIKKKLNEQWEFISKEYK